MAEPFKNLLNAGLVQAAAGHFARHHAGFDAARFTGLALPGLEALEMKARAMQICSALEAALPADFDTAAALIEATLAPAGDSGADPGAGAHGLAGWILWPVGEFIARRGQGQPRRALQALHALTQRFTAEFAIRPFIVQHPALVWATLQRWTQDPSEHVRRLVSEGSRPRLPWGQQLKALVADPSPTAPLLLALQDDPSEYVRRSVANHLNDIAKDHPGRVADWLQRHLPGAPPERRALLRHASRTLIKAGDRRVLAAWGLDSPFKGDAALSLSPQRLRVGEAFEITLTLRSLSARAQKLAVDYAVHHVKADGRLTPKVFKGWAFELPAHGQRQLVKRHSMREITTRRYHPGRHVLDVRVNGRVV
ncbi:MAG: putative 3-methylpurine-DNA glycosylase AlkC, partial [Pseudomonadota bacterium]